MPCAGLRPAVDRPPLLVFLLLADDQQNYQKEAESAGHYQSVVHRVHYLSPFAPLPHSVTVQARVAPFSKAPARS